MGTYIVRCTGSGAQLAAVRKAIARADHLVLLDQSSDKMFLVEGEEREVREVTSVCEATVVEPVRKAARPRPVRSSGKVSRVSEKAKPSNGESPRRGRAA